MTASAKSDPVRDHLVRALQWEDAHVGFDKALNGIPVEKRGARPDGVPYSAWQLLEHLRLAQHDILDFCVNADYRELSWPDDYWPASPEPPNEEAWDGSVRAFREDLAAAAALAQDPAIDLTSKIPHGSGQTYLRELLLIIDHNAYHVGELVLLRRLLGIWP